MEQDILGQLSIVQGNTVGMVFSLFHDAGVLSLGYGTTQIQDGLHLLCSSSLEALSVTHTDGYCASPSHLTLQCS